MFEKPDGDVVARTTLRVEGSTNAARSAANSRAEASQEQVILPGGSEGGCDPVQVFLAPGHCPIRRDQSVGGSSRDLAALGPATPPPVIGPTTWMGSGSVVVPLSRPWMPRSDPPRSRSWRHRPVGQATPPDWCRAVWLAAARVGRSLDVGPRVDGRLSFAVGRADHGDFKRVPGSDRGTPTRPGWWRYRERDVCRRRSSARTCRKFRAQRSRKKNPLPARKHASRFPRSMAIGATGNKAPSA